LQNFRSNRAFKKVGVKEMKQGFKTIALLGLGILCMPAFAANPARPGALNYVEGNATIDGNTVTDKNVGSTDLNPGQELTTQAGRAEILLTPGVFLRLDDNSAVKMISPDLTRTQIELDRGRAAVEVDQIYKENVLDVMDAGVTTQLLKNGFYEFDANQPEAMVFSGQAAVEVDDGKYRTVKSHHELALVSSPNEKPLAKEKPQSFDTKAAQDDFYNWSDLRSKYLAEANQQIAGEYANVAAFYPGWYWNPYGWGYTFVGAGPFLSPFGWGFYPPWWGGYGGFYGPGFYGGGVRVGHPHYLSPGPSHLGSVQDGFAGGFHGGGFAGGGFHGGGGRR
jgi:FecR protein